MYYSGPVLRNCLAFYWLNNGNNLDMQCWEWKWRHKWRKWWELTGCKCYVYPFHVWLFIDTLLLVVLWVPNCLCQASGKTNIAFDAGLFEVKILFCLYVNLYGMVSTWKEKYKLFFRKAFLPNDLGFVSWTGTLPPLAILQ